jgi:hypothetical protein
MVICEKDKRCVCNFDLVRFRESEPFVVFVSQLLITAIFVAIILRINDCGQYCPNIICHNLMTFNGWVNAITLI